MVAAVLLADGGTGTSNDVGVVGDVLLLMIEGRCYGAAFVVESWGLAGLWLLLLAIVELLLVCLMLYYLVVVRKQLID